MVCSNHRRKHPPNILVINQVNQQLRLRGQAVAQDAQLHGWHGKASCKQLLLSGRQTGGVRGQAVAQVAQLQTREQSLTIGTAGSARLWLQPWR